MALNPDIHVEPGVVVPDGKISDRMSAIVAEYEKRLGRKDEGVRVTSGKRSPRKQAEAMVSLIETKGLSYARQLYGNNQLAGEVLDAYESNQGNKEAAKDVMTAIMERQVANNQYLSGHMRGQKFDIATRGLANKDLFKKVAREMGCKVIDEGHCLDLNFAAGGYQPEDDQVIKPENAPELDGKTPEELEYLQDRLETQSLFKLFMTALIGLMQMASENQPPEQPTAPLRVIADNLPPSSSRTV